MKQHKDYALEESYAPQSTFFWAKGFRDGDTVDIVFQDDDSSADVISRRIGQFFLISGFDAEDAHKGGPNSKTDIDGWIYKFHVKNIYEL